MHDLHFLIFTFYEYFLRYFDVVSLLKQQEIDESISLHFNTPPPKLQLIFTTFHTILIYEKYFRYSINAVFLNHLRILSYFTDDQPPIFNHFPPSLKQFLFHFFSFWITVINLSICQRCRLSSSSK